MKRAFLPIAVSLMILVNHPILGQKGIAAQMDDLINAYEKVHGFSGAVKVVWGDSLKYTAYRGLADRSFSIKNDADTRFSINSISKTLTATLVLQLSEKGLIDLQAPISQYLSILSTWKDSINIHQLLSHSSGLPREAGLQWYDEKSFLEQLELVEKLELSFRPGSQYGYSNVGFIILGALVEKVTGESYHHLIEQNIIQPLNLLNTGVYRGQTIVKNQAVPYRLSSNGIETAWRTKHLGDNAGGSVYSNPEDLYRYIKALHGGILLTSESTKLLFSPHIQSSETEWEAYAWSIKNIENQNWYMAAGSGYGTKSVVLFHPETNAFIGINSNWGNTPILQMLGDIFTTLKGKTVDLPDTRQLPNPEEYKDVLGTYHFKKGILKIRLGMQEDFITLHTTEGKLFLNDETLVKKEDNSLGLSYTNELKISFEKGQMKIEMNGNQFSSHSFIPSQK